MTTSLFRIFHVESARFLPKLDPEHKCAKMHGHTFQVHVEISGRPDTESGWLIDFADIDQAIQPVREMMDHAVLNDLPGLENPTTENIAGWIWQQLKPALPGLSLIRIQENPFSGCIYSEP